MHSLSTRRENMDKENITVDPNVRITRARAKVGAISGGLPPRPLKKQDPKQVCQQNSKRSASDENKPSNGTLACFQNKKRVVLKDVSNTLSKNPPVNYTSALKIQPCKQADKVIGKKDSMVTLTIYLEDPEVQGVESKACGIKTEDSETVQQTTLPDKKVSEKLEVSNDLKIVNVDSKHKDPLMCTMYALDIYGNLQVMELDRRPSVNYMELVQRDITSSMRGILIDWIVEDYMFVIIRRGILVLIFSNIEFKVSEEYRLVPDTLYMTVNLIDRFLSQNHVEKQRLQLLGVTCILIASKYEEICAPRIEDLCVITDNTYRRDEVIKMESKVLNYLGFQLCVPTAKKFLRRFIQAAQASCQVPCVELEFLANYLAELTLVEYDFLKFLPSVIAASAVFLAKWTLNQSHHPWNPTLEHYTRYKTSDLKEPVIALQEMQLNTKGCSLNAIRAKYGQQKFKRVSTLSSPKPVESVF